MAEEDLASAIGSGWHGLQSIKRDVLPRNAAVDDKLFRLGLSGGGYSKLTSAVSADALAH